MKCRHTLLAALFSLTLIIIAVGCKTIHEHVWSEATCTTPKTCSECGATEGESLGHDWFEATCVAPKTCTRCGATEGESLGHDWQEATCTERATCKRCGETYGDPLGHNTPDLDCTHDGTCTRCGAVLPALGHDWKEATCEEPRTCSRCGVTEGKALGHQAGEPSESVTKKATCTEAGSYDEVITCTRCGKELSRKAKTEAALGHTTDNGVCARCGNEIYKVISGRGDDVISGIELGDGIYRVHFTNSRSNFIVHSYDSTDDRDLLVNEIGNYDGYVLLTGSAPYSFEITSSGKWTMQVERLGKIQAQDFSGKGDYVTDICSLTSGTYRFTHTGKHNFIVHCITTNGRDLLVNEIGAYDGKKIIKIPSGSNIVFEIMADGNWTIEKVD